MVTAGVGTIERMPDRELHLRALALGAATIYPKTTALAQRWMLDELLLYGRQVSPAMMRELLSRGMQWEDAESRGDGRA